MTILLIEDEPLIARQLHKMVSLLEPDAAIDGPLTSVQGICDYFNNGGNPNLVIADIQLSDGVSFEAFAQTNLKAPVIFTTAYDEYAIRAFKLNSIDYLLKPIDPEDLKAALAKFHRWTAASLSDFNNQFRHFLATMTGPAASPPYKRRFSGQHLRQIITIAQEEVAYFCRNELIYLYTTDGKKLITDYKTLDELEELVDPAHFFRANRQCIIHLHAVAGYRPQENSKLLIILKTPNGGQELLVSKEKAASFRQWIEG